MLYRTGPRNLITDVAGLRVGNAQDDIIKTGTTVILPDRPAVAGVQVLGGAPGSRETDALEPHNALQQIHAIALSGGSAFGLDAASGVQAALREDGIGVEVRGHKVPIVPAAIIFDLINGGDKEWGRYPPYRELGYEAMRAASHDFALGTIGAGTGALSAGLKGGLGSASTRLASGVTIGALAVANPLGTTTAPFEIGDEFGGLGLPMPMPEDAVAIRWKHEEMARANANTTIAVIATDAVLTKAEAKRLAVAAHDGFTRAIWPSHTMGDGDLVFALSTGETGVKLTELEMLELHAVAGATMARAIARGIHAATPSPGDLMPVWSSRLR
jgi:L-aminopeptidase/D-esterase-like protein